MTGSFPTYRYSVDADDRLSAVDSAWLAFANENGASQLTAAAVLGRRLWDFFAGRQLATLYAELHARIRRTGRTAVVPCRCDSPTVRRHTRLTIAPGPHGVLHYEAVLLHVEPRTAMPLIDLQAKRSPALATLCSCCKRALLEPEGWLELEEFCLRLRLFETEHAPEVRHCLCPDCAHVLRDAPRPAYVG
jgi:hypothetical protein